MSALTVTVDGVPVEAPVLSVRVVHRFDVPSQCEVAFASTGWPGYRLGAAMRVGVGDDTLFDGDLTCVELAREPDGGTVTRARGYDRLHRLRRRYRLRALESVTVAELAELVCADLDVTVDAPVEGPKLDRVVQDRQSDLELLVEAASRVGHHVTLDGRAVRLSTLDGRGDPVDLEYGHTLHEATVEANLDRAVGSVTAYGWHPRRAEAAHASADRPRTGRRVPLAVPAGSQRYLLDQAAGEVAARAQAELDESDAGAVVVDGVADGDPRLRAGTRIRWPASPSRSTAGTWSARRYTRWTATGTGPPSPPGRPRSGRSAGTPP